MGVEDKFIFPGSTNVTPRATLVPLATIQDNESKQAEESDIESIASSVHPMAAKSSEE